MFTPPPPLSDRRLLTYAAGNFGKNLMWGAVDMTLMFLLTDRLGVSAAWAGGLIFASLVLDAALYPWMGLLADRLRLPNGRYGTLILVGAPLAAFAVFALFVLIDARAPLWLIAVALGLFRIGYVSLDLSHNALLTLISPAVKDNGRIAVARFLFSSLATLTLAGLLPGLTHPDAGRADFALLAGALPLSAGLAVIMAWVAVRVWDRPAPPPSPQAAGGLILMLGNRQIGLILATGAVAALFLPLFNKACLYFATHWLGNAQLTSALLGALVAGQVAGLPLWLHLSPRWHKAHMMQLAHGLSATGFGLGALSLIVFGVVSPLLMACVAMAGIGLSGVYALIWAFLSDAAADMENRFKRPMGGQLFAWAIFLQKAAMGIGAGFFGLALSQTGYEANAVSSDARQTLFAFTFLLPVLGSLICIGLLHAYMSKQIVRQR